MSKTPDLGHIAETLQHLAVPIETLQHDPHNARRHPERNIDTIVASLSEYGQDQPLVVQREGMVVRKGNGRLEAARRLGWTHIAAVVIDEADEEATGRALADNRAAELATWDTARLADAIKAVPDKTLASIGFNDKELASILGKKDNSGRAKEDADDDREPRFDTKEGQTWRLGPHVLAIGDATDSEVLLRAMDGARADLIHTDPPYGVSYESQSGKHEAIAGDDLRGGDLIKTLLLPVFKGLAFHARDAAAWYVWHSSDTALDFQRALSDAGIQVRQQIVWIKPSPVLGRSDYQWSHEVCFYAAKDGEKPSWHGGRAQTTAWRVGYRSAEESSAVLGQGILVEDGEGHQLWCTPKRPKGKPRRVMVSEDEPLKLFEADADHGTVWEIGRDWRPAHPTQKPSNWPGGRSATARARARSWWTRSPAAGAP